MKPSLLTFLICLSLAQGLAAQSFPPAFFCTRPGASLRYERREPGTGALSWTHISSIGKAHELADGNVKFDFTTAINSGKMKSPLKGPVSSHVVVHPDGAVEMDVAQATLMAARQRFSVLDFTARGGTSLLPSGMKPGDRLKDIHGVVEWGGIKYTVDYTERKVLRRETISVPAGTYDCVVVQEHKLEKAPLYKRERITLTWYALGYGMVRHDTIFTDGVTETTEQLVSVSF